MSDFINVTILAMLQGVAEFLPISSSGHLVILQSILDVPEPLRMRLEIFLHAGTLMSIFAFYAKRLAAILGGMFRGEREMWLYAAKLFVSTIPAIGVYFVFKHQIESMVGNVRMVGALLMFTGAMLIGTRLMPKGTRDVNFVRAILMGIGQSVALLPGVSRSGTTLAVARGGRVAPEAAAEFSFLMSAPLIMGGTLLELIEIVHGKGPAVACDLSWFTLAWGVALSAVVGYASLALLVRTLKGRWFWLFGPYCILAGLAVICFCS